MKQKYLIAFLLLLSACAPREEGPAERAGRELDQANTRARYATEETVDDTLWKKPEGQTRTEAMEDNVRETGRAVSNSARKVGEKANKAIKRNQDKLWSNADR